MKGLWYFRWWGFALNEGGSGANMTMSWLQPGHWLFVYVYVLGRRWAWMWKRKQ